MSEKHRCEGRAWSGWNYRRCSVNANYEHNGLWYCKTHHPVMVKERDDNKNAEMQVERARKDRLCAIERAEAKLRDAYAALGSRFYNWSKTATTMLDYDKEFDAIETAKTELEQLNAKGGE